MVSRQSHDTWVRVRYKIMHYNSSHVITKYSKKSKKKNSWPLKYCHEVIVLVTVAIGAAAPGLATPIAEAGGLRMCVKM